MCRSLKCVFRPKGPKDLFTLQIHLPAARGYRRWTTPTHPRRGSLRGQTGRE